jgi:hypothetical protein
VISTAGLASKPWKAIVRGASCVVIGHFHDLLSQLSELPAAKSARSRTAIKLAAPPTRTAELQPSTLRSPLSTGRHRRHLARSTAATSS